MNLNYVYRVDTKKFFLNEIELCLSSKKKSHNVLYLIFINITELLFIIPILIIIFIMNKHNNRMICSDGIMAISRVPYGKIAIEKAINDKKLFHVEDRGINNSILCYIKREERSKIFVSSIKISVKLFSDFNAWAKNYDIKLFGFYLTRIPQLALYFCCLDKIISCYDKCYLYSSQIIDRFSYIEYTIAKHYNVQRICIPHGLEPLNCSVEMPCDKMFCTSQYSAEYLNRIYNVNKFCYEKDLVKKIYSRGRAEKRCNEIVFFSNGIQFSFLTKKYLLWLANYVEKSEYYNKLIFKPRYNGEDLKFYNKILEKIEISEDLDDCLSSKVCISFFSTTLYEALFNNSYAISIETSILKTDCVINYISEIKKIKNTNELKDYLDKIEIIEKQRGKT